MLARVAERIYWLGRYMERAENTARILQSYSEFLLDVPTSDVISWRDLLRVAGNEDLFDSQHPSADERSVVRFCLNHKENPAALVHSLSGARENLRTAREVFPNDAWELLNDCHLYFTDNVSTGVSRRKRSEFLQEISRHCLQFSGLIEGGLSRNGPYYFVQIGRFLERADMTTRILDLGAARERIGSEEPNLETLLWLNVLNTLSGYEMYRWHVQPDVDAEEVVRFVLFDDSFPRAVSRCLLSLDRHFRRLPRNEGPLESLKSCRDGLVATDVDNVLKGGLRGYNDALQRQFAGLHEAIAGVWFSQAWEP